MLFPTEYSFVISILAVALLIYYSYSGHRDGFVLKGCELLSTILCIFIAWFISGQLSGSIALLPKGYTLFTETILNGPIYQIMNRFLLFLILFILSRVLILLLKPLFRSINWVPFVGGINRLLGAILGFLQGALIIAVLSFLLSSPLFANGDVVLKESHLTLAKDVYRNVMSIFDDHFKQIESVQKMLTPSSEIEESDVENIKAWLLSQGFDETEQKEVMNLIDLRNGQ